MSILHPLLYPRANENGDCTKATCPAVYSIYGYVPNLGCTIFFLLLFILSGLTYALQGFRRGNSARFFTIAMILGSISEALGYVAKLLLHANPFSDAGFKMSLVLLTFAPAFYAAGIYCTLAHFCRLSGSKFSRLPPQWYTRIFISCDVFSILLQAIGGAISAIAQAGSLLLDAGTDIMIAGLVTQVATMLAFGIVAGEYSGNVYRRRTQLNDATKALCAKPGFKLLVLALWVAYLGILIRCCYRVAELVRGWTDNPILRSEGLFIGLDSVPIALAALALNVKNPGWVFSTSADLGVVEEKVEGVSGESEGGKTVRV